MTELPGKAGDASIWPIRSFLYVPASRPDWVSKAIASGVEAVILDLEDGVEAAEKPRARTLIRQEIAELVAAGVHAFLRPNAVAEGGLEDLYECVCPGLTGLILPKVTVVDIAPIHDALSFCEGRGGFSHRQICIVPMPETAEGIQHGYGIAKASPRVTGLAAGFGIFDGDISWSCGFRPTLEGREQLYIQSKLVLDSRSAGALYPVAGVFSPDIADLGTLEMLMRRARETGYTGAFVIHPSHAKLANAVFRPTPQETEHAGNLIAAMEEAHRRGQGAARYKGAMIDRAVLARAHQILDEAARFDRRDSRAAAR